jgi:polypyrimidine tract-binding protein 2
VIVRLLNLKQVSNALPEMSSSGQTQFRYTQTPSKVVHLRNLPWECVEEELIDLCKRFGKIVNTKSNVGANRNQAFVEFVSLIEIVFVLTVPQFLAPGIWFRKG